MNFKTGKFLLELQSDPIVTQLYATGDATGSGWTNSPPPSQMFTRVTNGLFRITLPFTSGKLYKFLSTLGAWQPQFGGTSSTGGALGANYGGSSDPAAIPTPALAGNYMIEVNFLNNTYTVVKQ